NIFIIFLSKATINERNGIKGETIFVTESPILYATCVIAGTSPTCINIGTKMGAIIAYFAESASISELIIITVRKINTINKETTNNEFSYSIIVRDSL